MTVVKYFAGIDIGAVATKAVIIDAKKEIVGSFVMRSGTDFEKASEDSLLGASKSANLTADMVEFVVGTGYGRTNIAFSHLAKTEISCHAKGSYHYFPKKITIIDIGGQDTKAIKLDDNGKTTGFKMNRKCAAGTGAFLEEIANRLGVTIDELDSIARRSTKDIELGSYCTVFSCTEILSRIRAGEKREDMIKGAFVSVIKRVLEMDPLSGEIVMTGGVVAHNPIIAELIRKYMPSAAHINVPPKPQLIGAFGAALFAREMPQCAKRISVNYLYRR